MAPLAPDSRESNASPLQNIKISVKQNIDSQFGVDRLKKSDLKQSEIDLMSPGTPKSDASKFQGPKKSIYARAKDILNQRSPSNRKLSDLTKKKIQVEAYNLNFDSVLPDNTPHLKGSHTDLHNKKRNLSKKRNYQHTTLDN